MIGGLDMNILNEMITKELKKKPCLHRAYGIVTEVITIADQLGQPKETGKYKVKIVRNYDEAKQVKHNIDSGYSIDTSKDITLLNKSHDALELGDYVWVHYWNTITDGYIAIKVGLSTYESGEETRPYHRTAHILDAYIIRR